METRIALRYSGPAVESGSMDVYDATGNMLAFSEFVLLAAKTEFGKDITARAQVAGFDRGSFVTDLVFHVTGISGTIFSGFSAEQLRRIIEDAFKLWKHLRGCAPRKIEPASAQEIRVANNDGDVIQICVNSLTLVMSEKGSDAVGRFVAIPEAIGSADPMRAKLRVVDPRPEIGGEIAFRASAAFDGQHNSKLPCCHMAEIL